MKKADPDKDKWLTTSRRAATRSPWEPKALDERHFVRKTQEGVRNAKSVIDTEEPKTLNRWKGKNFDTVSRRAAEAQARADVEKRRAHVLARVDGYSAPHEQKKDEFNVKAHPALLQRRSRDPSWGDVRQWQPPKNTIAHTRNEAMNARIWSVRPPWADLTQFGRPPSGGWRPERVTVTADHALDKPRRVAENVGACRDLLFELGMGDRMPPGALLGVKLEARDDLDASGLTVPASVVARRRARSASTGRRGARSWSRGRSRSGKRGRRQGTRSTSAPGSRAGSSGSGRSSPRGRVRVRASRSADGVVGMGSGSACAWCSGREGAECPVCGGIVALDEVDRELTLVKEKVLDSLVRHDMYSEEAVRMVIEDALLSHPQLVQHRLVRALGDLAQDLGVDCSDVLSKYGADSGLGRTMARSAKDLGLLEVAENSSDDDVVLYDEYQEQGSRESDSDESVSGDGEEGEGCRAWSSYRNRALGKVLPMVADPMKSITLYRAEAAAGRQCASSDHDQDDDLDDYLRRRDEEAVAKRGAAATKQQNKRGNRTHGVKFAGVVAPRHAPKALDEACEQSGHSDETMRRRLEQIPEEVAQLARKSWGSQWEKLSAVRRVAECKLAAELLAYEEDFKIHIAQQAALGVRAHRGHPSSDEDDEDHCDDDDDDDDDWGRMSLKKKVALCRATLDGMNMQEQVQAYTAHVREAAALLHMRAESDQMAYELDGGEKEKSNAADEWSSMSVEERISACAMVLRSEVVLNKAVTNKENIDHVRQRIRADGDIVPSWRGASYASSRSHVRSPGTTFGDSTQEMSSGASAFEREEEKRLKRAEKIEALGKRVSKAKIWFETQRTKLNEMIREHNERRPKDVGQARTARKGPTGGTLNMIKALECATFRPNPFTYKDRSLRWAFEMKETRIKEQRALVNKAKLRLDEIKEDLRFAQDEEGKPPDKRSARPVSAQGTDKYGKGLLLERIKKDETMSLPTRELKTELRVRRDIEKTDAKRR